MSICSQEWNVWNRGNTAFAVEQRETSAERETTARWVVWFYQRRTWWRRFLRLYHMTLADVVQHECLLKLKAGFESEGIHLNSWSTSGISLQEWTGKLVASKKLLHATLKFFNFVMLRKKVRSLEDQQHVSKRLRMPAKSQRTWFPLNNAECKSCHAAKITWVILSFSKPWPHEIWQEASDDLQRWKLTKSYLTRS